MLILVILLWALLARPYLANSPGCADTWFGSGCRYKCRCTNNCPACSGSWCSCTQDNCDVNGECINGATCQAGWFGPACQYADLAVSATVVTLPDSSQETTLTDGDDGTCLQDSASAQSINLTWTQPFIFTWLRVHAKDPKMLDNIRVQFTSDTNEQTDCINPRNATVKVNNLDIYCNLTSLVKQITLTGGGVKALCSVYVSGGRNVALKESPTQLGNAYNNPAENAVDGNTNSSLDARSCTHTDQTTSTPYPYWNLVFSHTKLVTRILIYNRDTVKERLQRFVLTATSGSGVLTYTDNSTQPQDIYTVILGSTATPISSVTIEARTKDYTTHYYALTLCEVEVYGETDCPDGKYGRDCQKQCRCAGECFLSTGGCPNRCPAGYQGDSCNDSCSDKFFGVNCKEKCSSNCMGETCDRFNGTCGRCVVGKTGTFCNQDCPHPTFGDNCSNICSRTCGGDGACHPSTGECSDGCIAGFTGLTCEAACRDKFFGASCKEKCSSSCMNETCDRFNGTCGSCVAGRTGTFCELAIGPGSVVEPSSIVGPVVGAVVGAFIVVIIIVVIAVVFWRRRRNSKPAAPLATSSQESVSDTSHYINSTFSEVAVMAPVKLVPAAKPKAVRGQADSVPSSPTRTMGDYYNTVPGLNTSSSIAVKDLDDFLSTHDKQFFQDQFATITENKEATMTVGLSNDNKAKNRYKNICAYDHSRVHLLANKTKKHGDYINASYVEGYKAEEKFIASQGPTKTMLQDFVRMLWEQKAEKVVMLTNLIEEGKHKSEPYWPEDGEMEVGEITLKLTTTQVFADYTIRRLHLSKPGEEARSFTHFHFTSWPDKDVPTGPWGLVDFEQRVASSPTSKPIVVHCSAGVGRTGTFIALRNIIKQAQDTGYVDFFTTVGKLRHDRVNMVQTATQYEFLHRAAQVAMLCLDTTVSSNDIKDRIKMLSLPSESGHSNMENEFRAVSSICNATDDDRGSEEKAEEDANHVYENSRRVTNRAKNRLSNILPKEFYRVNLRCEADGMGDYINAVFVPSFTKQKQQILTQLPLPSTVTDFWRLVTQYKVSLIVAFESDVSEMDTTVGNYLPSGDSDVLSLAHLDIQTEPVTSESLWVQKKVIVTINTRKIDGVSLFNDLKAEHHVTHLQCTRTGFDPGSILAVVKHVRSLVPLGEGRILYMCRNGADYSGLACILSLLLDRMDSDHCLTVPLVVGAIKAIRPQVIPTLEQYKVVYEVLSLYHDSINVYNNF